MKHLWRDAPHWANFLVMNEDGSWWWCEDQPEQASCSWFTRTGKMELALRNNTSWTHSLLKRPI